MTLLGLATAQSSGVRFAHWRRHPEAFRAGTKGRRGATYGLSIRTPVQPLADCCSGGVAW